MPHMLKPCLSKPGKISGKAVRQKLLPLAVTLAYSRKRPVMSLPAQRQDRQRQLQEQRSADIFAFHDKQFLTIRVDWRRFPHSPPQRVYHALRTA